MKENGFPPDNLKHKDPLSLIENDIKTLMEKNSELEQKLVDHQHKSGKKQKKILLKIVECVDAFERLFNNIEPKLDNADKQIKIWVNNFKTIYKLLLKTLESAEVSPIETIIGSIADPNFHKVVEVVEDPEKEDGIIVEEIKKGYLINNKLLRTAEVKAVKKK